MADEAKQFRAKHRFARISARKARLVADIVRGKPVNQALEILRFNSKRASGMLNKVIRSAMANAGQDGDVEVNDLFISEVRVDDGPLAQGRLRYRVQSRHGLAPIHRRTCHIQVQLMARPEKPGAAPKRGAKAVKSATPQPLEPVAPAPAAEKAPAKKPRATKKKSE
jgi:large subunit ribosomal protein L22